jgi:hypothetical protein
MSEWSASRLGRALSPEVGPPVPIVQEAGSAPEPVWTQRVEEKSICLCLISDHKYRCVLYEEQDENDRLEKGASVSTEELSPLIKDT